MNAILILERVRCWNRGGCLFPSDKKSVVKTILPFAKYIILQQFIDSLMKHPPEMEEGYEDLWLTAENAPRIIRLYNRNNNEIKSVRDDNLNSIVIEYGEDDGCDSPVLVETYTIREIRTSWDFVADEEFHHYFIPYIQAGILTDGQHFLYWNVTEDKYGKPTCHIHNSIRMDSDSEEMYYPWTSANNAKVIDALNNPAAGDNWCGEESVLLDIKFDEPEYKYAIAQIRFKEYSEKHAINGIPAIETVTIKLSCGYEEKEDDDIFFFCNSLKELEGLMQKDNGQDFIVLGFELSEEPLL